MSVAELQEIIEAAVNVRVEPPRPLRRELPSPDPYPVDALGEMLAPAARAIHARVQAPLAICSQSVLATATLAVQAHADVVLPFGQARPLSEYFIAVAESGERKTTADNDALEPVDRFESQLRDANDAAQLEYENGHAVWDMERRRLLGDKKQSREVREAALSELGHPPVPPLTPMLTCPEPTIEGLTLRYCTGRPSLGLFSNEGGQFVGGYGMSPDHRIKTCSALSRLWDGEPIRRVRAGDGSRILPGRRLVLHLMLQPLLATGLLADPSLRDQGILARMLPIAPDPTAGTRFWKDPSNEDTASLRRYGSQVLDLLQEPLPIREGTVGELQPRRLEFTPEATKLWIEFSNHIEQQLGPGRELESVRAFGSKAAEHATRLGAVLALLNDLHVGQLSVHYLAAGIELAQYYVTEWVRLHDASGTPVELLRAEQLLHWLMATWRKAVIGLPEIYQRGPNQIREARTAKAAISVLEEHGWVLRVDGGAEIDGAHRREAWRIVNVDGSLR